jgi:transcriptional regulator with XRE-family HTH domain
LPQAPSSRKTDKPDSRPDADLGERLAEARRHAGLTQAQLAEAADVGQSRIAEWETGKHEPGAKALGRLARALGISADSFFEPSTFSPAAEVGKSGETAGKSGIPDLPPGVMVPTLPLLEAVGRASVALRDIYRIINVNVLGLPPREVNEFGWRAYDRRTELGLSEAEAAKATGEFDAHAWQQIEHGVVRPHQMDGARRTRIAKGLVMTVVALFKDFPLPDDKGRSSGGPR